MRCACPLSTDECMGFKINTQKLVSDLTAKLLNPEAIDSTVRKTATTMLAEIKTRVFEEGQATSGDIGKYSTKPLYVSITANPGRSFGRPIGKTGRSTFISTGADHKSRYFERGYDQFKTAIGRNQLGKVNLSLSGQLNNQMTVIATSKGYGLGWANKEMFNRAKYFELKYKPIWSLTDREKEIVQQLAKKYYFEEINAVS